MNTAPTPHHTPTQLWLAGGAVAVMTVLFLLFEHGFMWLAVPLVIVTLLPLSRNDWTAHSVYWRAGTAGLVLVAAVLIWLT